MPKLSDKEKQARKEALHFLWLWVKWLILPILALMELGIISQNQRNREFKEEIERSIKQSQESYDREAIREYKLQHQVFKEPIKVPISSKDSDILELENAMRR